MKYPSIETFLIDERINASGFAYFLRNITAELDKNLIVISSSQEEATLLVSELDVVLKDEYLKKCYFNNSVTRDKYDNIFTLFLPECRFVYSQNIILDFDNTITRSKSITRLKNINKLSDKRCILVTTIDAFLQKLPRSTEFVHPILNLSIGSAFDQSQIIYSLVNMGYIRVSSAYEIIGEFAVRGGIIDIVTSKDTGIRINFCWNTIESLKLFDVFSQISKEDINSINIYSRYEFKLEDRHVEEFKKRFPQYFGNDLELFSFCERGILNNDYNIIKNLIPLFVEEMTCVVDYVHDSLAIINKDTYEFLKIHSSIKFKKYDVLKLENKILLDPNSLFLNKEEILNILNITQNQNTQSYNIKNVPDFYHLSAYHKKELGYIFDNFMQENKKIQIILCFRSESERELLRSFVESNEISRIKIEYVNISYGFIVNNIAYITFNDLFGNKKNQNIRKINAKNLKNVGDEINVFSKNQLVVHKNYGIGRFLGIIEINTGGRKYDCAQILYANNDKIYVPVENLDLIKRYGLENADLDRLGNAAWQKRQAAAKDRIGELAHKLLKIEAKRKECTVDPILSSEAYDQFSNAFEYIETEDQSKAIEDIKKDLASGFPMDRLLNGDVGFGKTEVAMRAAFLVANFGKQVIVVTPTTILCRQHYRTFCNRFSGTGIKIAQLSRLVKRSDAIVTKLDALNGNVDILICTHSAFAKDMEFKQLGLVILDEEQHFGVTQKERLKELNYGVHILSMSATPIPRTLQMSVLGIKELSVIATPPTNRAKICCNVIHYDLNIIRDALLREYRRGGKSFYVCPRISDIDSIAMDLKNIVPELKFEILHAQMKPSVVDGIMNDFIDNKFDILLSTSIIESGIDISTVNTIIIHRSEMFGLSQLYQLRGRVGRRGNVGYAYITVSDKVLTKNALKRIEILQSADFLGAGFIIASHDMDIRGFGNLVGDEQSGHIKEVGVELYQDMLQSAIMNLKNETTEVLDKATVDNPIMNIGLSTFIPKDYIEDENTRIGIYKRLSDLRSFEELSDFRCELIDRFGQMPKVVENLCNIIEIREMCRARGIQSLDFGSEGIAIKFYNFDSVREKIISFVQKNIAKSKLKSDGKLIIVKKSTDISKITDIKNLLNTLFMA